MEWWAGGLLGGEANKMNGGLSLILSMCGYVCVRVQKSDRRAAKLTLTAVRPSIEACSAAEVVIFSAVVLSAD